MTNRYTHVRIEGNNFEINGQPTLNGKEYKNHPLDGLLFNARFAQALFDDENPETVDIFAYPDTNEWDADRNVKEFIQAMPEWRAKGLQALSINFQCGKPVRRPPTQPWTTSGFRSDGTLKQDWLDRLEIVLKRADILGFVVIVGYFYYGQQDVFDDDESIIRAASNLTSWLAEKQYTNVLVKTAYITDRNLYYRPPLQQDGFAELANAVHEAANELPLGVSMKKNTEDKDVLIKDSDFIVLKGKDIKNPDEMSDLIQNIRNNPEYSDQPIIFHEDPLTNFDTERTAKHDWPNNMYAAIAHHVSWGYHNPGTNNYYNGFQSPPVKWNINTEKKSQVFDYLEAVVGADSEII